MPRGKCATKRERIIWGKRETNNIENRGKQRRSSNRSKERSKHNRCR